MAFRNMALRAKFILAFSVIALIFAGFAAVAIFAAQTGIILGAAALGLLLIFVMLSILIHGVADPAARLADSAKNLADGEFKANIPLFDNDDEIGRLSRHLSRGADALLKLQEANRKAAAIIEGNERELENVAARMEEFINGELAANMGYGQKSRHIAATFVLARTLSEIVADTNGLIIAATSGDFRKRLAAEKYEGDWRKLAHNLNALVDAVATSVEQARSAMDAVAAGRLDVNISADARGDLLRLKTSVNNAVTSLAKYVGNITRALENVDKRTRFSSDLPNDFAPIKTAIDALGDNLAKSAKAAAPRPKANLTSISSRKTSAAAPKKFSGAVKLDGLEANLGGTPSYMRPDFGKY